jgi:hypothetical protein
VTLPPDVPGNEFRREFLERIRTIDDESTARRPQRSSEPEPNTSTGETTQAKSNDQDESPPCGETTAKEADDDKTAADEDDVTKEPASASPQPKRSARTGNSEAAAESNAPKGRPDVQITVDGDRILIYCEDEEELNRIEALIENLAAAPSQTNWTVYRLKTPDSAESTAQMIGSLFPEGTVTPAPQPTTTTTGGRFSSQFGSRGISTDSSGLNTLSKTGTLKIIPDVRLNSLIITGPEDIVGQVLEWVKYFDNAESLADKRTQRFQLKHARVAEVAEHVFELFREEMGFPVQNNMQTQNGLAGTRSHSTRSAVEGGVAITSSRTSGSQRFSSASRLIIEQTRCGSLPTTWSFRKSETPLRLLMTRFSNRSPRSRSSRCRRRIRPLSSRRWRHLSRVCTPRRPATPTSPTRTTATPRDNVANSRGMDLIPGLPTRIWGARDLEAKGLEAKDSAARALVGKVSVVRALVGKVSVVRVSAAKDSAAEEVAARASEVRALAAAEVAVKDLGARASAAAVVAEGAVAAAEVVAVAGAEANSAGQIRRPDRYIPPDLILRLIVRRNLD